MMVYCSFCGKSQEEVQKIIAGNNAFICNECVELAQEIIREELAEEVLADLSEVPKPIELLHILNHYVIGQDRAKRALAVAVYNHYKRINFHDTREDTEDVDLQKSNMTSNMVSSMIERRPRAPVLRSIALLAISCSASSSNSNSTSS